MIPQGKRCFSKIKWDCSFNSFTFAPHNEFERKAPEVAACLLLAYLTRHPSNKLRRKEFEQVERQASQPCFLNLWVPVIDTNNQHDADNKQNYKSEVKFEGSYYQRETIIWWWKNHDNSFQKQIHQTLLAFTPFWQCLQNSQDSQTLSGNSHCFSVYGFLSWTALKAPQKRRTLNFKTKWEIIWKKGYL